MFFSIQTIAAVATAGIFTATGASAFAVEKRSTSLCNQAHYGASGYPWQSSSTPGSFCSSTKPSNNKYWKALPYSDTYDKVRCSTSSKSKYNVCSSGNKKTSLPNKCNPPHWKNGKITTYATSTQAATSSAVVVASSASSAAASSVTVVNGTSSAPVITSPTTTSAAATTSAAVDPLSNPVCELTYQATYLNYTAVAPNGVWMGMTVGAATQDASYMTYTLATSVDDCLRACDQIEGCVFVNTYYDVNEEENYLPKHADGVLTCSMYSTCVGTDKNDNYGGQDDPNTIVQSNGYCKSGACS